jgi:hypothetical protein
MTSRQTTLVGLGVAIAEAEEPRIYSEEFRAWYAAYPRKRAPGRAWRAWNRIAHRPPLRELIEALAWQVKSENWTRDRGQWIPYPETYLHGRQWEDEPPARSGYCPFHGSRRNDGWQAPRHCPGCPECQHVAARNGSRQGAPSVTHELTHAIELREPKWTPDGETMLARDFAEAFPGAEWPGKSEAWRRLSERMREQRHGR